MATITLWQNLTTTTGERREVEWRTLFGQWMTPRSYAGKESHPGWSPATFRGDQRANATVEQVSAIAWDYDNNEAKTGTATLDDVRRRWAGCFGFLHATRSSTPQAPRWRLVLPLARPVSSAERMVLWRALRDRAGSGVDESTSDSARFWFAPGVSELTAWHAEILEGEPLDPDAIIAAAVAESRSAPVSPPPSAERVDVDAKTEKRARAYLSKCDAAIQGSNGSRALFLACFKLRGFGLSLDDVRRLIVSDYNPRCAPPWSAKEIEHKLQDAFKSRVRPVVADREPVGGSRPAAQWAGAPSDDGERPEAPAQTGDGEPDARAWERSLRYDEKDRLTKDPGNAALLLAHSASWRGCLSYDAFADRVTWAAEPPAVPGLVAPTVGDALVDAHVVYAQHWLAIHKGLSIGVDAMWSAMAAAARCLSTHPLRDWLRSLQWDGQPRLDDWVVRYAGADPTPYHAMVGRWWMLSAVARALSPGCQADHILVLEGPQGAGKTSLVRILGRGWVLPSLPDLADKDARQALQGRWIVEIGELDALRGVAATRVKDFLSQTEDVYRPSYGRATVTRPRSCVFVGTTNEHEYLSDPTGARRFWPVKLSRPMDLEGLRDEVELIWAEAVARFEAGEKWWPGREDAALLEPEQAARQESDPWEAPIRHYIDSGARVELTVEELLGGVLEVPVERHSSAYRRRVAAILRRWGWEMRRRMRGGERQKRWSAPGVRADLR